MPPPPLPLSAGCKHLPSSRRRRSALKIQEAQNWTKQTTASIQTWLKPMERWLVNKCQYQQVCFVELHKIMSLTWMEWVTDRSIYFSPSVVKSNKSDLKIMNKFMFSAWGTAGPPDVLLFMETPWNNIFLLLCFSSASRSHLCADVCKDQEVRRSRCDGWGGRYQCGKHLLSISAEL